MSSETQVTILQQLISFAGIGVVGTAGHYVTLVFLVQLMYFPPVIATTIGFVVGAIINYVLNYFAGVHSVRITWADYDLTHVEAFYARGDRSLAPMIYEAYQRGQVFETFREHFNYDGW